mgnify:FL=1
MDILITGARGFVGRNLVSQLRNVRAGKARWYAPVEIGEIFEYDIDSHPEELDGYCRRAGFVFNLAGVNRPKDEAEFMAGNFGFASTLLESLRRVGNACPVMLSSSVQASLDNAYGRSKRAGEDLFFRYGRETGARVLVYRFSNLFGKWCRPNYNSVVATFCHNTAHGLPIRVDDAGRELPLCYIDDVVDELIGALAGHEHRDGDYCTVPIVHHVTLGRIADLLRSFREMPSTLDVPDAGDAFARKLYATYLTYLPVDGFSYALTPHADERGSFTEVLRMARGGQVSVNVSKPGVVKGRHWHHTKVERFVVVAGHGLVRQRRVGTAEVVAREVWGDRPEVVETIPGWTHELVNLSPTENMVTLIWCNECFDPSRPDTYAEEV